jgi:uncharacterized protein DUF2846
MRKLLLATIIAVCGIPVMAQQNQQATVYVYRLKSGFAKWLKPSVYCDSKDVGRIENGHYMKLYIDAGKHFFRSNDKESGFEIDAKPGQEYFVRVDMIPTMAHGHGRVLLVQPEEGKEEVSRVTRQ